MTVTVMSEGILNATDNLNLPKLKRRTQRLGILIQNTSVWRTTAW